MIQSACLKSDLGEREKKRKFDEEAAEIEELRKASLESFRESKMRKSGELSCIKQARASRASAISFIGQKVALEGEQKESGLQLRAEELECRKNEKKGKWILRNRIQK